MIVQAARAEGLTKTEGVRRRVSFFLDGLHQEMFLSREISSVLTEEHLRAAYERMLRLAPAQEEVHARHILVEKRETAQDLIDKLNAGEDFATLAQRHSKGPSATSGGDLGFFGREQMVPEFAEVAFALESGAVIPTVIDQNPCAHLRMPRDMIFHGWSMRLFQAWQHSATMSS